MIMIIFHLYVFLTVMCSGPKKNGAVTAADGTSDAKHAIIHRRMITRFTSPPPAWTIGIIRLKNSSILTVFDIKFVRIIHPRHPRTTIINMDILDVNGARIVFRHAEIPAASLLMAVPSTETIPIKSSVVIVEVLVISRKSATGLLSTWIMHNRLMPMISGRDVPHLL